MKRSSLIVGVIAVQFLLALFWCGVSLYLLWLTHSASTLQSSDPKATALGLEIAAAATAPPALLGLIGAYGLKGGKLWGWWLTLLTNVALVLVLGYSMNDDGWRNIDVEDIGLTAISLLPLILLLLPAVCRYYWRKSAPSTQDDSLEASRS